ncbi:hypothetical protein PR048_005874 [Dryococelus australis]|uniref:HAT C-terminal dimerisation domain-containing protein n=1 Tax=Dryococelus australis TaxID=614101 RepID=A0ABQ9I9E1_9NEOP|nr:hypothetical protein PR048_005874 [Dryococelus australis]
MQVPKLKVIQDVETRWCSEFVILKRLHILREHIAADLIQVLRPFTEATKESSGNTYQTASMVIPIIHCLKAATENYAKKNINGHGTGVSFARNLLKALISRLLLFKMDDINCVATIVHQRYKAALFHHETERLHAFALLKKEIPDVIVDEVHNDGIQDHQVEKAPSESLWDVLNKLSLSIQGNEPDPKMKAIDTYLAAPCLARHCNQHDWWRKNQHLYPVIAKVAANYLALTATQVASERVFSTSGNSHLSQRAIVASTCR